MLPLTQEVFLNGLPPGDRGSPICSLSESPKRPPDNPISPCMIARRSMRHTYPRTAAILAPKGISDPFRPLG